MQNELKGIISSHLDSLKDELTNYFPDISSEENWQFKLVRDPFSIEVVVLPDSLQEQAIDMQCDSQAKEEFPNKTIEDFWLRYLPVYPQVALEAVKLLVQFSWTWRVISDVHYHN